MSPWAFGRLIAADTTLNGSVVSSRSISSAGRGMLRSWAGTAIDQPKIALAMSPAVKRCTMTVLP